jgi:hypothetical protein
MYPVVDDGVEVIKRFYASTPACEVKLGMAQSRDARAVLT